MRRHYGSPSAARRTDCSSWPSWPSNSSSTETVKDDRDRLSDPAEGVGGPQDPTVVFTGQDVVDDLAGMPSMPGLLVLRADRVSRSVLTPEGPGWRTTSRRGCSANSERSDWFRLPRELGACQPQVLLRPEQFEPAPHWAAWYSLAGVRGDGDALGLSVHRDHHIDVLRRVVLSVASADDDGVVVGGDVLRAESGPADR